MDTINQTILKNIEKQNPQTEEEFYRIIAEILEHQTKQMQLMLNYVKGIKTNQLRHD